jgi:hypothetical protein
VVISHDCDLAQSADAEPSVEVIIGRFVDKPDGTYTHCKNLRRLHLSFSGGEAQCTIEIEQRRRTSVPKEAPVGTASLVNFSPRLELGLKYTERRTLQRWLASRYERSAFPDEFDRRLRQTKVAEFLPKAFKDSGQHIPGVYFDVDEGQEVTRDGPDDPYRLVVTLLYLTEHDGEAAEKAAYATKERIEQIFEARCRVKREERTEWQWIELQAVEVMSDHSLTYAQSLSLMKWQADHISLRDDPQQPIATP